MSNVKITCVGGGSYNWMPKLLNDIIQEPVLEKSEIVLLDPDLKAAQDIKAVGEVLCKKYGKDFTITTADSSEEAFKSADFVLITISTGGLKAMKNDLEIPEKFRIYQTVGDTVGPGGWSRTWRNVPVFIKLAQQIEKHAPNAFVLNYTNPMYSLTSTLNKMSDLKVVGLCHGVFGTYRMLELLFGVEEKDIKVNFAGLNHFFWILDFTIKGKSGYPLLEEKLQGKTLYEVLKQGDTDEIGYYSKSYLWSELYEQYGYLSYAGDRHTCEFLPQFITGSQQRLKEFKLVRTFIKDREEKLKKNIEKAHNIAAGKEDLGERSRETAIDIMKAVITDGHFIDIVNLPNRGQVANLPQGVIVESLGNVNRLGFCPLVCGKLPDVLLRLIHPHVMCQEMLIEAAIKRDSKKALKALLLDPVCSHLKPREVHDMGELLLKANERYEEGNR